jgi:hypothetical protein
MLEPHLTEKNHQEEAKLWHPEPPAHTELLQSTLQRNQEGFCAARCWLHTCLADADQENMDRKNTKWNDGKKKKPFSSKK